MSHVPVMVEEALKFLDPKPNQNFVDCTIGDGSHSAAILQHTAPVGRLLGIDADPDAITEIRNSQFEIRKYLNRIVLVNDNFRNLAAIVKEQKFGTVQGILLDLGFSSSTLERGRGFSFEKDELLDMRFDVSRGVRAAEIVNSWNQKQLAELLTEYGEERLAREIANRIVEERKKKPMVTSKQLSDVVVQAYREKLSKHTPSNSPSERGRKDFSSPARGEARRGGSNADRMPWIGGLHPATRTFQALRIAVNDELGALQAVLPQAVEILHRGGRLAVIAFHSLEDRIVKQFFRQWPDQKLKILTKKPVVPSDSEIRINPRARSAKMRVIEKL
ncbi:16S rRNA (cytosine(1402)-N(4))-methyltransferase RsmH [Candidatus Uhrbacteria bacterium]|nr:16S rRNA (cytosine(1402)-N(4))-methyltransferase RsmH [Candidatus Uhrbacteria bacterium]